jgi:hypothetical protein
MIGQKSGEFFYIFFFSLSILQASSVYFFSTLFKINSSLCNFIFRIFFISSLFYFILPIYISSLKINFKK